MKVSGQPQNLLKNSNSQPDFLKKPPIMPKTSKNKAIFIPMNRNKSNLQVNTKFDGEDIKNMKKGSPPEMIDAKEIRQINYEIQIRQQIANRSIQLNRE